MLTGAQAAPNPNRRSWGGRPASDDGSLNVSKRSKRNKIVTSRCRKKASKGAHRAAGRRHRCPDGLVGTDNIGRDPREPRVGGRAL